MRDYFLYLPQPDAAPVWGAAVTAAGFTRVPPGADYPLRAAGHPADHRFTWERGRVLEAWQVVLILEGGGWFESQSTGRRRIAAGDVFLLLPGVWHRYRPDPQTGWVESWLELEGPLLAALRRLPAFQPRRAVLRLGPQPELAELLDRCHLLAQHQPAEFAGRLATTGLQILALLAGLARQRGGGTPAHRQALMRKAQVLLMEQCEQPPPMEQFARQLGMGYSHFRRCFRQHTGLAPKPYVQALRLRRVQDLLRHSELTIKEIAERLGYHSPFHLSAEFKKSTGLAPARWRQRCAAGRPVPRLGKKSA
jgi:AraC-like DNA-binding protein